MVAGQSLDLAESGEHARHVLDVVAIDKITDSNEAREADDAVRNLKTSALMRLALRVGAILSGATEKELAALSRYAELIGEAYQTSDDLLDLREDALLSSATTRRSTFANERGAPDTKKRVAGYVAEAKRALMAEFGTTPPARLLCDMADYIAAREA
jgi:geranylgeranyl pyrophosphate synthase